jgi:hypothetical protein
VLLDARTLLADDAPAVEAALVAACEVRPPAGSE